MRRNMPVFPRRLAGVGLIEVLVAMFVMLFGLLALAGLLSRTHTAELESYERKQALIMLDDMAGRLAANRNAGASYAVTTDKANGSPNLGSGGTGLNGQTRPTSVATPADRALLDLFQWDELLKGYSVGGSENNFVLIGARGCISSTVDASGQFTDYTISVAWRGQSALAAQSSTQEFDINCAKGVYTPDDAVRRVVSTVVRVPGLN